MACKIKELGGKFRKRMGTFDSDFKKNVSKGDKKFSEYIKKK